MPAAPAVEDRRAAERVRLHAWIAGSRRVQRRLWFVLGGGVAASIGAWIASPVIGESVLATAVAVWGIGRWITAAHISDWETRLDVIKRR